MKKGSSIWRISLGTQLANWFLLQAFSENKYFQNGNIFYSLLSTLKKSVIENYFNSLKDTQLINDWLPKTYTQV